MASDWQWFVLQTAPQAEFQAMGYLTDEVMLADQGLTREDLHVLLPLRYALTRPVLRRATDRRTRRSLIARPRIPGYLLLGLQPHARLAWKAILELPGVIGVLGHAGLPQPMRESHLLVAMLQDFRLLVRRRRRNKGLGVEIANGPYQGKTAAIVEIAGSDPEIRELFEA